MATSPDPSAGSRAPPSNGLSITKTLTALAILQLVDRGVLGLDDPVTDLLPGLPYPRDITVRHLLTHAAGLPNPLPLRWIHLAADPVDRDAFFEHGGVVERGGEERGRRTSSCTAAGPCS